MIKTKSYHLHLTLFTVILVAFSCSPYKKNIPSKIFHNTTAHYNAYFIAHEKIKEVEDQINRNYKWNYNRVLPIYPQFDTISAKSYEKLTEDVIQKSSIAIQRHPNSKWLEESYTLVGKARLYNLDFTNAIETFKYVNTHSENKDERHIALIGLMRTFVENGELRNAEAVSDYLKRESLNKTNLRELYLLRAYYYQKREDYNNMVKNLVMAEPYLVRGAESSRIYFLMGQLYQELGFEAEAYNNYRKCLKLHPPYELAFFAKLNMTQVTGLSKSGDIKRARKYFKTLLADEKNKEYKDKIYYEMANFELKQGNLNEAIGFYKNSVESSTGNQRQKAYSYWKLSEIYYDKLKDFRLSKSYYDSTIATMPKDEEAYDAIAERQLILEDFVKNLDIVETNDSLLYLASLDTTSLFKILDKHIQDQIESNEAKKKRQKEKAAREAVAFQNNQTGLISTKSDGAVWYFYNTSAISQGNSEFVRKWGNRPLEDNWRRSSKGMVAVGAQQNNPTQDQNKSTDKSSNKETEDIDPIAKRAEYVATIPYKEEAKKKLIDEVEVALYNIGSIYYFKLNEKKSSVETFETLLKRFPTTKYAPEVMYELYLAYQQLGMVHESEIHKNNILSKYPESIYAKLIKNPNYREESQAISAQLKKIYEQCYKLFQSGNYEAALTKITTTLKQNPDNEFSDNLELLRILIVGKTYDVYKYQYELNNFVKNYSESELIPYAETLIKASEEFEKNQFITTNAKFINDLDQKHYYVLVYESKDNLPEVLPKRFENYIKEKFPQLNLTVGNLILTKDYSMILINQFQNKDNGMEFFNAVSNDINFEKEYLTVNFHSFAISIDNFNIFYQSKDFEAYKRFFKTNY